MTNDYLFFLYKFGNSTLSRISGWHISSLGWDVTEENKEGKGIIDEEGKKNRKVWIDGHGKYYVLYNSNAFCFGKAKQVQSPIVY